MLAGFLITIVPVALILVKLFSAYRISFKTSRGMHSGILLAALILFAYSLLVGLSGFWTANWFKNNSLALTLIGHCVWLAVYGGFTSLALFMVILVSMLLRQLVDWTRSRLGNP
jgi:hypothetical protein